MKHPRRQIGWGLIIAMAGCAFCGTAAVAEEIAHRHEVIAPASPVPGESIYQLEMSLTDERGTHLPLDTLRGKPALITMFYTTCQSVCPMLAFTLRRVEQSLSAGERRRLRVAMVSFDPQNDTPAALDEFARLHKVDRSRWLLARAPEDDVRELAAVLGIRYRELSDGVFSHSAVIILLDADGVVRARTETLQQLDPQFMQTLRATLANRPAAGK